MKQRVVMICLEGLGIGGVETAVINQAIAMTKKKIKVVVLAKDGIYKEKLLKLGAHYIDWNFELKNNVNFENIKKIRKIINVEEVTDVIINQFPCINDVVFACLLENVPYVAYVHSTYTSFQSEDVSSNVFKYFSYNYPMFEKYFDVFFSKAAQIITITPILKEYLIKKYNIEESKISVIPNSIDVDSFLPKSDVEALSNFLLVSRLSEEKMSSIKEGLEFFKCMTEKHEDKTYSLKIIGDGDKKGEVISLIDKLKIGDKVQLIGEVTNVMDYMEECDVVLGIDRCLLEAIAMKRVAIICGYDGLKGLVSSSNIDLCISENFSGRLLENVDSTELVDYIATVDIGQLKNLIYDNYENCLKNLDINKNISFLDKNSNISSDTISSEEVWNIFDFATNKLDEEGKNISELKLKVWELENMHVHVIADKQLEIDRLNLQLEEIYSSRSYKFTQKLKRIFGKK